VTYDHNYENQTQPKSYKITGIISTDKFTLEKNKQIGM